MDQKWSGGMHTVCRGGEWCNGLMHRMGVCGIFRADMFAEREESEFMNFRTTVPLERATMPDPRIHRISS